MGVSPFVGMTRSRPHQAFLIMTSRDEGFCVGKGSVVRHLADRPRRAGDDCVSVCRCLSETGVPHDVHQGFREDVAKVLVQTKI